MTDTTLMFLPRRDALRRRLRSTDKEPQHLGNKLHEIACRSPKDLDAFDTMADYVLERLNQEQAQQKA